MTESNSLNVTLGAALIDILKSYGVKYIFGVPGGGSSLELIAAAEQADLKFVLCKGETSAALAASVTGELTNSPGVVLTAIGPGAASAVNGVAYAYLEHAPLILISDARDSAPGSFPHQVFDLKSVFNPITKATSRIKPTEGIQDFADLVSLAMTKPYGPIFVELSAGDAAKMIPVNRSSYVIRKDPELEKQNLNFDFDNFQSAIKHISQSKFPLVLLGMYTCSADFPQALQFFVETLGCPFMTTYKAKGVIADEHPQMLGHFTGAESEQKLIEGADLLIWIGVDPVELIPVSWNHTAHILALGCKLDQFTPNSSITDYPELTSNQLNHVIGSCSRSSWEADRINILRDELYGRLKLAESRYLNAESVVKIIMPLTDDEATFTVDAGAHMISVMAHIKVRRPKAVIKSTGLSTMGFALPAAIAIALIEPRRQIVALTGDGGLMMCLPELSTAVQMGCRLTIVVFNDAALSLIDVKQQRRQQKSIGVRYPAINFQNVASGLGCKSWKASDSNSLIEAMTSALDCKGVTLVDVAVTPDGYLEQLTALRG